MSEKGVYYNMYIYLFTQQCRPIIICEKGDTEAQQHASSIVEIPGISDCLQGILCVIPMQLLSFHIAVLRGFDVSSYVDKDGKCFFILNTFFCILTKTQKNRAGLLFSTNLFFTRHNRQTKTISTLAMNKKYIL